MGKKQQKHALHSLFRPDVITIIGASQRVGSVGYVVMRNLMQAGFQGVVLPVHPKARALEGVMAYASVAELPLVPDMAVICTPPASVPSLVQELGEKGCKALVIITAGLDDRQKQQVLATAATYSMRIIGNNCLGVMVPPVGINASFSHKKPLTGKLALISQSGAMATSVIDWATSKGIGFSHVVSLGDKIDIGFGELIDYLADDADCEAILLYIEAVSDAERFMAACRRASPLKPIVAIKGGRFDEGAKAAASHTGALAGSDAVYDAAFRQAGVVRSTHVEDFFNAIETIAYGRKVKGNRLCILTNGGGLGVLATDTLVEHGGQLATLSPKTIAALDKVLPATWSHANPVDIIGDASGERYANALNILLKDKEIDGYLIMNCPTAVSDSFEAAQAIVDVLKDKDVPVLTTWLGDGTMTQARHLFRANSIPTYATPDDAARAFVEMARHTSNKTQCRLASSPYKAHHYKMDKAHSIIDVALREKRPWLNEVEAKTLFAAWGISTVLTKEVKTPLEARAFAEDLHDHVVIKILSKDILHKSDVGGVALNLKTPDEVQNAAEAMLARVKKHAPKAKVDGFAVQRMIAKPRAYELIIGVTRDAVFGPVVLFGQGGTAVEVIRDQALILPPMDMAQAEATIQQTRIYKLLLGYRNRPAVDIKAIADVLIRIGDLAVHFPMIEELDINPVLIDENGLIAVDGRVKLTVEG